MVPGIFAMIVGLKQEGLLFGTDVQGITLDRLDDENIPQDQLCRWNFIWILRTPIVAIDFTTSHACLGVKFLGNSYFLFLKMQKS